MKVPSAVLALLSLMPLVACSAKGSEASSFPSDAGASDAARLDAGAAPTDARGDASSTDAAAGVPVLLAVVTHAQGVASSRIADVYVTTYAPGAGGDVVRVENKPGGAPHPFGMQRLHPGLMAFDSNSTSQAVLWVDTEEKSLWRVAVPGSGMSDIYPPELVNKPQSLGGVAAGEHDPLLDFVFAWTDPTAGDILYYRGTNSYLAHGQTGAAGITFHRPGPSSPADYAYWARPTAGTVSRAPVSGNGAVVIATGEAEPYGVAADDGFVYWTNRGDGTIVRAELDGSNRTVIAAAQGTPLGIDVDDIAVYWVNAADGSIMRLTK